jgi:hypothetical protein
MRLVPLFVMKARVEAPTEIGKTLSGTRRIFVATGGEFQGERLSGRVAPGGGEWFLQGDGSLGQVDVRLLLETHDGAPIYMRYSGLMDFTEGVLASLASGRSTQYGDNLFLTQARFEAGDARYAWLNRTIAVGEGRMHPDCVEYSLFEVAHD